MTINTIWIKSLKVWHDVTNLKFIIYLMIFQYYFYPFLSHTLYLWAFSPSISYIVNYLSILGVACKTQVISFLQVNNLFTTNLVYLGNPFEVVVYYFLIRGMTNLNYRDRVLIMSVLVYIVTLWTGSMMGHDIRLSCSYDFTKVLNYNVCQPWENIDLVS